MNGLQHFGRALSAEQLKIKHSWAWRLVFLAPLFACGMYFCIFYFKGEHLIGESPAWNSYFFQSTDTVYLVLLPLFIILLNILVHQLDHNADSRKILYTLPTPKWIQVSAQWLNVVKLFTISMLIYLMVMLISGKLLEWLRPELGFDQASLDQKYYLAYFKGYLASFGILAFQFIFTYFLKNMVLPMGIGMAAYVSTLVLLRWKYIPFHPFAYGNLAFRDYFKTAELGNQLFTQPVLLSLSLTAFLLILGLLLVRRLDVK
ncbi:ABC transporter permease [Xanthovirga aplysinae]|uniref:ABC transporter permease n=1 Tax=Xanthovirga aplysinae TaxID=2529853 RepID=UPI0012BBBFAA|nr:ABC transporter permease [Xanthovirga aplysinae]MTI33507.1 hypothetical protein [Xanthovirga aplysinae]